MEAGTPEWIRQETARYHQAWEEGEEIFLSDMLDLARDHGDDVEELHRDYDNFVEALEACRRSGREELFAELVAGLCDLFLVRGEWERWWAWSQEALEEARHRRDHRLLGRILFARCRLLFRRGALERMEHEEEEAESAAERAGDGATVAALLYLRSALARKRRDFEAALAWARRSVARLEESGEPRGAAIALYNLGAAHEEAGEPAEALSCFEKCLRSFRRQGLNNRIFRTQVRIARCLMLLGRGAEALARLDRAAARFPASPDTEPREHIHWLSVRSQVEESLGRREEAMLSAHEALLTARDQEMGEEILRLTTFLDRLRARSSPDADPGLSPLPAPRTAPPPSARPRYGRRGTSG